MPTTIEMLDQHYASELDCMPEDLTSGKLVISGTSRVSQIRFAKSVNLALFSFARCGGAVISARSDLRPLVDEALLSVNAQALDNDACEAIQAALTPHISSPSWFLGQRLYCEPATFADKSAGEVRQVTAEDDAAAELHSKWGGEVYGQVVDGRVVSWAAIKPFDGLVWDLSIRTLPEYRGKGYARSVVSAATKHVLAAGKLVGWGCDRTNRASLRTAYAVGFQDYALEFGCIERS